MSQYCHAVFDNEQSARKLLKQLTDDGIKAEVFSPYPLQATHPSEGRSAVRWFTFTGGVLGFVLGAILTVYAATHYLLPTGGRPIITFPPFLLVAYELTILVAVIATLIGFLYCSGLPAWRERPYERRASVDGIVISAKVSDAQLVQVQAHMQQSGAKWLDTQRLTPEEEGT